MLTRGLLEQSAHESLSVEVSRELASGGEFAPGEQRSGHRPHGLSLFAFGHLRLKGIR